MSGHSSSGEDLKRVESLSISPELFEKLYLSPENAVKGDLRKTFGNPTPLALIGFLIGLSPLACMLMGWRGASGAAANVGGYYFFARLLLTMAAVGEFLLGNTFPMVVFFGYGGHFFTFGATFQPFYGAVSAYTTNGSQTLTPGFASSFGFYVLFMGLLSFVFMICSPRTNAIFVGIFLSATTGFCLAAGAYWTVAQAMMELGGTSLVGAGAALFTAC